MKLEIGADDVFFIGIFTFYMPKLSATAKKLAKKLQKFVYCFLPVVKKIGFLGDSQF